LTAPAAPKPASALLIRLAAAAGLGTAAAAGNEVTAGGAAAGASLRGAESGR
jgi:hypothetical protein